ncbi:MAG: serine hydrolase [Bacteriovoracaceae bacterium]|nr:serine hydrolase [Bacteriovoracaceae bacterium]
MKEIKDIISTKMKDQHFDSIAVGVLDFDSSKFESFEYSRELGFSKTPNLFFDLASLTKPLTLATSYLLNPNIFSEEMKWLLCHRGSLPSWGLLDRETWREQVSSYPISLAKEDLYSDFSALRLMLEIEKVGKKPFYENCSPVWDKEVCHWSELKDPSLCPPTGFRNGHSVRGEVHDPNAWVIKDKISHAGLFGTINGVCKTILNLENKSQMRSKLQQAFKEQDPKRRFILGWDRVQNPGDSVAGNKASDLTFGHLGFTGTSIWIDLKTSKGVVILSNATQNYWYDKLGLNGIRRAVSDKIW